MSTYVTSPEQLRQVQIAEIGTLRDQYTAMMAKARDVASRAGVSRPRLLLDIRFKPGAHPMGLTQYIYPINEDEWSVFQADIDKMCNGVPTVHVVDGNKYTAMI